MIDDPASGLGATEASAVVSSFCSLGEPLDGIDSDVLSDVQSNWQATHFVTVNARWAIIDYRLIFNTVNYTSNTFEVTLFKARTLIC